MDYGKEIGEEVSLGLQQLPTHLTIASADSIGACRGDDGLENVAE